MEMENYKSKHSREVIYREALREIDAEIDELKSLKLLIEKRLGELQPGLFSRKVSAKAEIHLDAPVHIERGARIKVAKEILENEGKPMKTRAIVDALNSRGLGLDTRGKRNALYTTLLRDPEVRKVGPGLWGLESWYKSSP